MKFQGDNENNICPIGIKIHTSSGWPDSAEGMYLDKTSGFKLHKWKRNITRVLGILPLNETQVKSAFQN